MKTLVRLIHFLLALLPLAAIGFEITHSQVNLVNYFSLFTILSNLIASFVLFYLAVKGTETKGFIDSLRGATTSYLLVTAIVYFLLLRNVPNAMQILWVNAIIHKIMPAVIFIDWFIFPPNKFLKFSQSFRWLIFPILYLAYALIRGSLTGWYPYAFINPETGGFVSVLVYTIVITLGGLLISSFVIILGNLIRDRLS